MIRTSNKIVNTVTDLNAQDMAEEVEEVEVMATNRKKGTGDSGPCLSNETKLLISIWMMETY